MGPTWGPPGAARTQVVPMLATRTLLSELIASQARNAYRMVSCCCRYMVTTYLASSHDRNSLMPSDAYMRQYTNHHWFRLWLVAWLARSHYLNQLWNIVNGTPRNKLQWNLNRNAHIFFQEIACENIVWIMSNFLSRPHCVNTSGKPECSALVASGHRWIVKAPPWIHSVPDVSVVGVLRLPCAIVESPSKSRL